MSPETIENFSEQIVFNSCNQSGFSNTYHITNPIEKINALYEELIIQLKERITSLESVVDAKNEVIDLLKKK